MIPHYSKKQIREAVKKIEIELPDRDMFDGQSFQQFLNTDVQCDFTRKDLKRINVKNTNFITCSFIGAAATGSRFNHANFSKCNFRGANFQDCYFNVCSFEEKTIIKGANFSNSIFIGCTFDKMTIVQSTFFDCRFEDCLFESCKIYSDTSESSILYNCQINDIDLAHINIDYMHVKNVSLNKVVLPPYQIAYIIGAPSLLKKSTHKIQINTDHGKISKDNFCELYPDLVIYYFKHNEFFPLANLLIADGAYSDAYEFIKRGIKQAYNYSDFRMIKHYCRLACCAEVYSPHQLKDLYNFVTQMSYDNEWDLNTLHSYMLHIGAIRELLLNHSSNNTQCVEISIKTNIEKDDLSSINKLYNEINSILRDNCSPKHIDSIELRHNSPYEIYITCLDALPQILAVLSSVYGILTIGNKFVDLYKNIAETKRVWQENDLYKFQREQMQLDIKLKQLEIQQKEQANSTPAHLLYTVTEIEHNIKCNTLEDAKTIDPGLLHYKYTRYPTMK